MILQNKQNQLAIEKIEVLRNMGIVESRSKSQAARDASSADYQWTMEALLKIERVIEEADSPIIFMGVYSNGGLKGKTMSEGFIALEQNMIYIMIAVKKPNGNFNLSELPSHPMPKHLKDEIFEEIPGIATMFQSDFSADELASLTLEDAFSVMWIGPVSEIDSLLAMVREKNLTAVKESISMLANKVIKSNRFDKLKAIYRMSSFFRVVRYIKNAISNASRFIAYPFKKIYGKEKNDV